MNLRVCRQCDGSFCASDHDPAWSRRKAALQFLCPKCIEWHHFCTHCNRSLVKSAFTLRFESQCKACRNYRTSPGQYHTCKRCLSEFRGIRVYARDGLCPDCRETHKYCSSCNEPKPHAEFYSTTWVKDGMAGFCKACRLKRQRPGGKSHAARLRREYGLDEGAYESMMDAQQGVCAICHNPEVEIGNSTVQKRALAVDHCHESGRVRGLLCRKCNTAIGLLNDDPGLLRLAAAYIERSVEETKSGSMG